MPPETNASPEVEIDLQPSEPESETKRSEPPEESQSQATLMKLMQQTMQQIQQTVAAMGTRVEMIEGVQQQQSEKLTAALEEATELASVYREQISQFDSLVQNLAKLQSREERQLAVLVKLAQADQEA